MKKMLSALLLIVMLCQVLPFDALAAVGRVLTDDELARAYALTGFGENEGQYHNGMRPNASWNAAQLIHYLEDRLSKDIYNLGDTLSRADYAVAELEQTDPAAYREYMESGADDAVQHLRVEAEALRQEMRYYKTRLEESAGLIAELSHMMQDDGDSMFDSEKVRYSARIEEAVRNLTADRQTVAENIDAWEAKANQLRNYIQEGPYGSDEDDLYVGDILGELFKAEEPVHNTAKVTAVTASSTRLSRLAADAGLATNDVDFTIDVMTEHQVGISLCREENKKRVPVTDVTVQVKDILKSGASWIKGDINEQGNVIFESNKFTTDEYDCVRLALKIDGGNKYRSILIDDLDLDLGVPYEIVMETLDASSNGAGKTANASGKPYLVSAEFGSKDILYSNYDMLYSPVNNYDFEIKVVAANILGSPDMTMTWYENDGSFSKLKKCTATAKPQAGNVYIFKGPWKQRFSPNANDDAHRPTFSFDGANAMKKTSRLISNRGAADQPINEGTGAGGGVFGKVLGQGMGFSTDIPLGGDHKIHLGLNLPFTEYLPRMNISPDGSITMWIGSDVLSDLVKEAKANWQSKDLKTLRRAEEKLQKNTALADYKAKMALNYNYTKVRKLKFIAEASINFGVFAVARGSWNLDSDDPDVKTKLISLTVGAGFLMNCEYSWGWQFTVGPVPVEVTFSLGLSVGFGIDLQLDLCWVNNQFQNWKFQIIKEIDISIGIYFSAQLGVGIKGFLEAYVKFSANLNVMVRLSIQDKQPSGFTVTYGCALTVGATVFFIDFSYTWNFLHGQLYPKVEANLLDHYMNAEDNASEPEEAAHQDPQDYSKLKPDMAVLLDRIPDARDNVKYLVVEGHTYAFFLSRVQGFDGKPHWRLSWKREGDNTVHSMQDVFSADGWDSRYFRFKDSWKEYSAKDDYSFDVVSDEGLVFVAVLNAGSFDEHGLPKPRNQVIYNSELYALILEPDASGNLSYNLSVKDANGSNRWAGQMSIGYTRPEINVTFRYADVIWKGNKADKTVDLYEFYIQTDSVSYDQGLVLERTFWYSHTGISHLLDTYSTGQVACSMGSGYRRSKVTSTMCGALRPTNDDLVYDPVLPFVALCEPANGGDGDRVIEYFDWKMNNHQLYVENEKAVALAKGDITDFRVTTSPVEGGVVSTIFYVERETNNSGDAQYRLKGLYIDPIRGTPPKSMDETCDMELDVTQYDYDVTMHTNNFQLGYIGAAPYLYWWNASPKVDDTDSVVWRIWAVAYDAASNTMSDAFVVAQFELPKTHVKAETGEKDYDMIPTRVELTSANKGFIAAIAEEKAKDESVPRVSYYSFTENLKGLVSMTTAIPQHTLVKAGNYEDVDLGIMNEGNVAVAAFDVEMREVDKNGAEGSLVQTVHVNCHEPEKSSITMANNTKPILTGKEVAHRAEDFDFSPRQRDFIHKTETVTYKMKVGKTFEIGNPEVTSDDARHLTSDLVMPGSLADIMASFKIPGNWSGQKKLRLRVVRESVDSNWLRTMANAAGLASNADDGSEPVLLEYKLDRERNVMVLQRPAVSNAAVENAIESGIFANEVEAGDPVDLMVHVQDIDVDHRVYAGWDGQDWLSFSVKNHAATGDQLKLTCAVYVDDAEEPYYLNLPYYKQATSTRRTQTFCAPLSALVDDVNLHQQARLVISAVGVEESAWINNEFTVNLAGANPLRFVRQPEDVVAQEGEDVAFTVEVTGGVKPYACQWQVWDPKHEKWVDLPGFTDPTLSRKDIEKKWDGARFRCVVTDAEGTQIISREVTLTVRKGVDTGDNSNLPLYLAVALGALALLWFMRRRSLRG